MNKNKQFFVFITVAVSCTSFGTDAASKKHSEFSYEKLNTYCNFNDTIVVGQWMRDMCASEDELAALVAHEKAHLVLKHGEKAWYEKLGGWVSSWFVDESKPHELLRKFGEAALLPLPVSGFHWRKRQECRFPEGGLPSSPTLQHYQLIT